MNYDFFQWRIFLRRRHFDNYDELEEEWWEYFASKTKKSSFRKIRLLTKRCVSDNNNSYFEV